MEAVRKAARGGGAAVEIGMKQCARNRSRQSSLGFLVVLPFAFATPSFAGESRVAADFEAVATLIMKRCLGCHNAGDAKGNLVLATRDGALAGGDEGAALVPGHPDGSYLLARVRRGEMPPEEKGESRKLGDEEVRILEEWIRAGAPWPEGRQLDPYAMTTSARAGRDWWSLRPRRRPEVPGVGGRRAHPVDSFILSRLREHGMTMAPRADRTTLIRRAYFDLLGLPPSPDDVRSFVEDPSVDAYEKLIDRLLASPHHGERWARYWLDLVRFAETNGYERDKTKPFAWKYRDWVIRAFNDDMAYDRFVREQLAGDELPERSEQSVAATGFLRLGPWNDEPNDPFEYKYERLEDLVHTTTTAFLGVTVKCARCHDHKFDPIPQVDYYRLASVFWAGFIEPHPDMEMGGPKHERLGYEVLGWTDRAREVPDLRLLKKGDPRHPGPAVPPGFLSLVPDLDRPLTPPPAAASTTLRRSQLARWIGRRENPLTARVFVNRVWLHHFGAGLVRTPNNFGFMGARPTHPLLLDWLASEFIDGGWSVKRLHRLLMTSETYRQASIHPRGDEYNERDPANRLWWRARRRRLDAEALRDSMLAVSGQLELALHGPSFFPRVSAEALEGLSKKGATWGSSPARERHRRSVYIFTKRSLLVPLLTTFDFCDTTRPCGRRDVTIVAPQALALLNNEFVHEMSDALARRVAREAGAEPRRRVTRAWELAFRRRPDRVEMDAALAHLAAQENHFASSLPPAPLASEAPEGPRERAPEKLALASLCHVLLNANEFIYVD